MAANGGEPQIVVRLSSLPFHPHTHDCLSLQHGSVATDKKRCASIFANLLKMHDTQTDGAAFIREFMQVRPLPSPRWPHRQAGPTTSVLPVPHAHTYQTKRCDEYHPEMKQRREAYRSYVNESGTVANVTGTWDRIMSFKEEDPDQRIANQCVLHYLDYDRSKIVSGVSWSRWTRYYTIDQAERTLAAVGLFATGLTTIRGANRLWGRAKTKAAASAKPPAPASPSKK